MRPIQPTRSIMSRPLTRTGPSREQEEWLRGFDYHSIQIISIHEVYPGHFVHALHSRSSPSLVSKALRFYSFTEGWAHYTEEMMVDEGYGADDLSLKLAQIRDALLRNCRYMCSIGMHTQGHERRGGYEVLHGKGLHGRVPREKGSAEGHLRFGPT